MRTPRDSYNIAAITAIGVGSIRILQGGITTGRVFKLRHLTITNEHAATQGIIELWDQAAAVTPTAGNQRGAFVIPANDTVQLDFPAPGISFSTDVTMTASAGTFAAYSQLCNGYEE